MNYIEAAAPLVLVSFWMAMLLLSVSGKGK